MLIFRDRLRFTDVFPGWWLVASGAAIQILIAALLGHVYGAYMVLLQREFGWTKATLSAAASLVHIESGLLGPVHSWLIDRYGPRLVMGVGMAMLGSGFIGLSQVDHLHTFFLSFLVMAAGGSLAGYMSICVVIVSWFRRRRSLALSLISMGGGAGGLIVPFVVLALERWGWRIMALSSGIVFTTIGLLLTRVFWHHPEDRGLTVDGAPDTSDAVGFAAARLTTREVLMTPAFWTLSLGHASALFLLSAVMVHLVPHLTETLGLSLSRASIAVTVLTTMMLVGLLVGGATGDRFDNRRMAVVYMIMHGAGVLCLAFATSWRMVAAFAVLHGVAWGARGPLMQAMRAEYFGRHSYAKVLGLSAVVIVLGTAAGPVTTGALHGYFGGYRAAFISIAFLGPIGGALFAFTSPPSVQLVEQDG